MHNKNEEGMHNTFHLLYLKSIQIILHLADRYYNLSKGTNLKKITLQQNILLSHIAVMSVLLLDCEVFLSSGKPFPWNSTHCLIPLLR